LLRFYVFQISFWSKTNCQHRLSSLH
jgi:hypothetical protein